MDFSNIFRIANMVAGVIMILGGIAKFFPAGLSSTILGCYIILFGLVTGGLEFQIPSYVSRYASFFFSFLGRGIFYIFVGSLIVGSHWPSYIAGAVVGIIGIAYAALEFIPSIEPPTNMRDAADGGWGAEQV